MIKIQTNRQWIKKNLDQEIYEMVISDKTCSGLDFQIEFNYSPISRCVNWEKSEHSEKEWYELHEYCNLIEHYEYDK